MKKIKLLTLSLALFVLVGLGAIVFIPAINQGIVGQAYYEKLQKIGFENCAGNEKRLEDIKRCLEKIGESYSILGDTNAGNFRITISKPYAATNLTLSNWEVAGLGAGVRPTVFNHDCFIHQNQVIPKFGNKEMHLLKTFGPEWFKANPEAQSRFITGIRETTENIIIESSPLGKLKDYVVYCQEFESQKYLDDYGNIENDKTVLMKRSPI